MNFILADVHRRQEFFEQDFAWMDVLQFGHIILNSVAIDNLDLVTTAGLQAARSFPVSRIRDSAGIPSARCRRRIICSVSGRLPFRIS